MPEDRKAASGRLPEVPLKADGSAFWRWLLLTVLVGSLSSCSRQKEQDPAFFRPTGSPSPAAALGGGPEAYQVEVWLDQPHPVPGEQIVLHGSLLKHGVRLGAIVMEGYWPDPVHPPGVPDCRVQVIYGSGVCNLDTSGFESGQLVTLRVKFIYQGETFWGKTGLIPE